MSSTLTPSSVFRSVGAAVEPPTLGLESVGMYVGKPPQTPDNHSDVYIAPFGTLLNRSVYSILWMTAQKLGWVQSEENWQAAKTLSPTNSVSFYSDGTDGTNFRTPDIGETGGFTRYLGSNGSSPVGGIETGFDWQIENIVGTFDTRQSIRSGAEYPFSVVMTDLWSSSDGSTRARNELEGSGSGVAQNITFDASRVVKAGDQTTPQGFYQKLFIYSGADITKPAPAPSVEQILAAASYKNLLHNTDLANPINQKGFDGNWAGLSVDEQGWDLWRKKDSNNIFQVIEAGSYLPNTDHILQVNNVVVWQGKSPASGHWGVVVPNTSNKIDLRPGSVKIPWSPEDQAILLANCERQFQVIHAGQQYGSITAANNAYINVSYIRRMISSSVVLTKSGSTTNIIGGTMEVDVQDRGTTTYTVTSKNWNSATICRLTLQFANPTRNYPGEPVAGVSSLWADATLKEADVVTWTDVTM